MNLPHAARIATRIRDVIERHPRFDEAGPAFADEVDEALAPIEQALLGAARADENPPREEAVALAGAVAERARALVEVLERYDVRSDRLGQCVRNFFECLEMGEEGAAISLRAGESPDSAQRPR